MGCRIGPLAFNVPVELGGRCGCDCEIVRGRSGIVLDEPGTDAATLGSLLNNTSSSCSWLLVVVAAESGRLGIKTGGAISLLTFPPRRCGGCVGLRVCNGRSRNAALEAIACRSASASDAMTAAEED